jgi:hypothetical protein
VQSLQISQMNTSGRFLSDKGSQLALLTACEKLTVDCSVCERTVGAVPAVMRYPTPPAMVCLQLDGMYLGWLAKLEGCEWPPQLTRVVCYFVTDYFRPDRLHDASPEQSQLHSRLLMPFASLPAACRVTIAVENLTGSALLRAARAAVGAWRRHRHPAPGAVDGRGAGGAPGPRQGGRDQLQRGAVRPSRARSGRPDALLREGGPGGVALTGGFSWIKFYHPSCTGIDSDINLAHQTGLHAFASRKPTKC